MNVSDNEPGKKKKKCMGQATCRTFGPLFQHAVEAAQWRQLQGETERVDADAQKGNDAGVLQRMQHASLLPELREGPAGIHGLQVLHHGVCVDTGIPHMAENPVNRQVTQADKSKSNILRMF